MNEAQKRMVRSLTRDIADIALLITPSATEDTLEMLLKSLEGDVRELRVIQKEVFGQ